MQFVELFGQTDLCWRGHGATGFVTGYEVDVIHHTARVHPASVLAHAAAPTRLACLGTLQRGCGHWRALGQVLFFLGKVGDGILFPLEFVGHPTQSGETILFISAARSTSLIR
jgi:hypothetical protein